MPWYDERFTGYLEDKVVHIQSMVHMGFSFAVHPGAFVVHYPHPDSRDQALVKSTSLMQEVSISELDQLSELRAVSTRRLHCSAPLVSSCQQDQGLG